MNKMTFDFKEWRNKRAVVHCETLEQAELWCKFMGKHNIELNHKGEHKWEVYKEKTCYNFNSATYSSIDNFVEKGYEIIEFSDIYQYIKPLKERLKTTMLVELENGFKYLVIKEAGIILRSNGFIYLHLYDENLVCKDDNECSIVKIYKADNGNIWQMVETNWDSMPIIWDKKIDGFL